MSDFILKKEHVGQEIVLISSDYRNKPLKYKAEVLKVNPKTVVLNVHCSDTWIREKKLYKSDHVKNLLVHDKNYSGGYRVHLSEKQYDDHQKALAIRDKLRDVFSHYGSKNYTLEQLEQVAEILGLERK